MHSRGSETTMGASHPDEGTKDGLQLVITLCVYLFASNASNAICTNNVMGPASCSYIL